MSIEMRIFLKKEALDAKRWVKAAFNTCLFEPSLNEQEKYTKCNNTYTIERLSFYVPNAKKNLATMCVEQRNKYKLK